MSSWLDMHEIIDLPRIPADDIVPDNSTHLIYVNNPLENSSVPYVPIIIAGHQWDFLWWIYRLSEDSDMISFDMFALEYIERVYENYVRKKD